MQKQQLDRGKIYLLSNFLSSKSTNKVTPKPQNCQIANQISRKQFVESFQGMQCELGCYFWLKDVKRIGISPYHCTTVRWNKQDGLGSLYIVYYWIHAHFTYILIFSLLANLRYHSQRYTYIQSAPNNSNEIYTSMCLSRAGRFGQILLPRRKSMFRVLGIHNFGQNTRMAAARIHLTL